MDLNEFENIKTDVDKFVKLYPFTINDVIEKIDEYMFYIDENDIRRHYYTIELNCSKDKFYTIFEFFGDNQVKIAVMILDNEDWDGELTEVLNCHNIISPINETVLNQICDLLNKPYGYILKMLERKIIL